MNAKRKERIDAIAEKLKALQIEIEEISQEEQDAFDNMPENMQGGDRGETMQRWIDALEVAAGNITDAVDEIEGAE